MLARKKVLGDYQVGKTIGQGAFSKVKLGYHKETGQKVAIKIIDKKQAAAKAEKAKKAQEDWDRKQKAAEAAQHGRAEANQHGRGERKDRPVKGEKVEAATEDIGEKQAVNGDAVKVAGEELKETPTFVSQLQLEVQLLMRLDHPNVIRLYQVMETELECFVVMEYAQGGELIEYIAARSHLSEKEARRYFRQIVSAMDHCHLANVVHRDLKLENLLLNGERNLLISDFGLGRTYRTDAEELMRTFCGTPNYAAVELISGIPYIGVKSDIWAMGVVLYVMMTGRPPFFGENISALYSKIKAVDYKCPDYFSQGLRNLLAKILVKDPKRRIDMDGIRDDPWMNYEEVERPLRLYPKVMGSADASQISQFISGITFDQTFVIFTFRRHTRDGASVYGANGQTVISQAQKRDLKRRKSLTVQTGQPPNKGSGTIPSPGVGDIFEEDDIGDKVTELPSEGSNTPRNTRGLIRRNTFDANAALSSAPEPPKQQQHDEFQDPSPRRQRRNTSTAIFAGKDGASSGSPDHGSFRKRSVSAAPEDGGGFAAQARPRRRGSVGQALPNDRESNLIRRMSMVGPGADGEVPVAPPSAAAMARRASMSPTSGIAGPQGSKLARTNSADDPDPMLFSEASPIIHMPSDELATEEEPSKKEIEDWHMLHRPPKIIRTVRFAFHSATTSTQAPSAIFQEVHRVLVLVSRHHGNRLSFRRVEDYYMLNCKLTEPNPEHSVEFEVEVCKVWLLKMHGVRIKRLSGSPFIFKETYSDFVSSLEL